MATGYEVKMYADISAIRKAMERSADAQERIANALEKEKDDGERDE